MLNAALTRNNNGNNIPLSPIVNNNERHKRQQSALTFPLEDNVMDSNGVENNSKSQRTRYEAIKSEASNTVCVKCINCSRTIYPRSELNYATNFCNKDCETTYSMCNRSKSNSAWLIQTNSAHAVPMMPQISPIENHHKTRAHRNEVSSSKNNYWERDYGRRREMMELENSKYSVADTDVLSYDTNTSSIETTESIEDVAKNGSSKQRDKSRDEKVTIDQHEKKKLRKSTSTNKILDWILMRS